MYFKFQRRYNLLTIADDFAHLKKVGEGGDLEFDFFYTVSPHDAVSHGSLTVKVSVFSRTIKHRPVLEGSHVGFIDNRKLINNVLTATPNAKSVIKKKDEFTVASRNSDITAKINNEIVGQLAAKVPARSIQQLNKKVMKLVPAAEFKASAEAKPVLQQIGHVFALDAEAIHSSSQGEKPSRLMYDMITRQGIDPSSIVQLTHRSIPSIDAVGGILRPVRSQEVENSPSTRLFNHHVFSINSRPVMTTDDVDDSEVVHVLSNEPETHVEVPVSIVIPRSARQVDGRDSGHFFVKFELINGRTGVAIDVVTKSLDVDRHVQLFNTPRRAPIVKVVKSEVSSHVNLEIKQVDPGASSVRIYKKVIHHATPEVDDYELVGNHNVVSKKQSLLVPFDAPRNSVNIYRIVPVGSQGTVGFEFTNAVVRPIRYKPTKALVLTVQAASSGVRIEARKIPHEVVAIEFKARNRTIHESNFHNVTGGALFVDDAVRAADSFTLVDTNVSPNHIYEYAARLIYESGLDELVGHTMIEVVTPQPGKVDTKIENVVVNKASGDLDVTFSITTTVIDSNLDVVKALLQKQDIFEQFKDDVLREREFLKSLIAHNVQRVDLTTGAREDFGVVITSTFSDRGLRKNQAVRPLVADHHYRYEVTALLRTPETMFETLGKEKVDAVTKKTYTFSPAKFLHPLTLRRGVIVSSAGLKARYPKEAMAHGAIGDVETFEVSFGNSAAWIADPAASRFDKFLNVITWKVQGDIGQIDHFLIMKDVHGVRTMIGKAHSEFLYGSCQYLHQVTRRDEGSFSYVIVPIFNDYRSGNPVVTNLVTTESHSTNTGRERR